MIHKGSNLREIENRKIVTFGLLLTDSKNFAKVGRQISCTGCTSSVLYETMSGPNVDVNYDASCEENDTLLYARNPCNNSFGDLWPVSKSSPYQISPNFPITV